MSQMQQSNHICGLRDPIIKAFFDNDREMLLVAKKAILQESSVQIKLMRKKTLVASCLDCNSNRRYIVTVIFIQIPVTSYMCIDTIDTKCGCSYFLDHKKGRCSHIGMVLLYVRDKSKTTTVPTPRMNPSFTCYYI